MLCVLNDVNKKETEYVEFNKKQKITSDFDHEIKKMIESGGVGK